jgi:DNA-binding beta-propeller fold protein YncE
MRVRIGRFLAVVGSSAIVFALAAAAASAVEPSAFTQLAGAAGCAMQIDYDVDHGCARVGGLDGAHSVTLSADDKFVFVASGGSLAGGSNGVVVFARDMHTGALTKVGCLTAGGGDGRIGSEGACARGDALLGAADVAIGPDGRTAYVASAVSGGVAWIARDVATGALTPVGCVKDFPRADRCIEVPGLRGAATVAPSPDGLDVYVGSPVTASIHALRRDAVSGALAAATCVSETGSDGACVPVAGLQAVHDLAVAPDGRAVYAAGGSGAVAAFARDPADGSLRETSCLLDNPPAEGPCKDAAGIAGAAGVAVSPDGRDVYVASTDSEAVSGFRVQSDGTLRQTGCVQQVRSNGAPPDDRCDGATALPEPRVVVVSADGGMVFAGGSDTITSYRRDPATGKLEQLGCAEEFQSSESCFVVRAAFGVNAMAASSDGRNVYVTADEENAVTILGAAVTIDARAVRADRRGRVRVLLRCPEVRASACAGAVRAGDGPARAFRLRPGARARVRVTLGRRAIRAVRRHGSTRAAVSASDRAQRPTRRMLLVRGR